MEDVKVGDYVEARYVKYHTSIFEGAIKEIKSDDISIRPKKHLKGAKSEIDFTIKLNVLLGIHRSNVIKVL